MATYQKLIDLLTLEGKVDTTNSRLASILAQLDDATADTVLSVLKTIVTKLDAVGGTVALDAATLAALESVTASVTGTVALDAPTLAALENITVTVANPTTGQATETTLAAVLSAVDGLEAGLSALNTGIGTDGTSAPPSGSGVRGWLRAIYEKLAGTGGNAQEVRVNNLPTNQQINGQVSITGTPTVQVGNFPANQAVSGSVNVTNIAELRQDSNLKNIHDRQADGTQRTRLLDANGVLFDQANRVPVTARFESVVSTVNSPQTPLLANGVFLGEWEDVRDFAGISGLVFTDVASATNGMEAQFSRDAATVIGSVTTTIPANVPSYFEIPPEARYFRVKYTNGLIPQGFLRTSVIYRLNPPGLPQLPLGGQTTDANVGGIVQSHQKARHSSGAWFPLNTDGINLRVSDTSAHGKLDRIGRALTDYEQRIEYYASGTETGKPKYLGKAPQGELTSASTWNVKYLTYVTVAGSLKADRIQVKEGISWDARTTSF